MWKKRCKIAFINIRNKVDILSIKSSKLQKNKQTKTKQNKKRKKKHQH